MIPKTAPATRHPWKFFRTGGLEQVALETAEDLLALNELDPKLWVALSCPVKGLEIDEKTLDLIDSDRDGHIHVDEVIAAVKWASAHLKRPGDLLEPSAAGLSLASIDDLTPEGKTVLSSARLILSNLGKANAEVITVEDTSDTTKILDAKAPNGDGVVTLRATSNPETQALIKDILATTGGVPDRTGGQGVNAEKVDAFFAEVESYLKWVQATAEKNIPELGAATGAASIALRNVRGKIDDYFARCRLAAFDFRATAALNRQETDYLALAAKDLVISANEVAAFPLARVDAVGNLPLLEGVNPAWRGALATLHRLVVAPLFGQDKTSLTADDWAALTAKFEPYESWLGSTKISVIEKIGAERARALLDSAARRELAELIAKDKSLAADYNAISSVARLARYSRDLRTLLHNFVNFADFYSPERLAVFQAGMLFLDGRSCELCIPIDNPDNHAKLAIMSKAYVAYLDCTRTGGEKMKIAACFTQGDSDYLFVGRNGLFYDRKGRDWDATITKILDNPISIRQAFWSPYKKFIRMIEEQVAKRATAAESETHAKLSTAATTIVATDPKAPAAPPPPPKKFDVGTVAALGVGLGALTTAFGMIFAKFVELPSWKVPLVIIGIILAISLPSVIIAWLKLRQRTIGPLLEANGWAINGRVKVNIPFGAALTQKAMLPKNARRMLHDPYADQKAARRRTLWIIFIVVLLAATITARVRHTWPFDRDDAEQEKPAAGAPAPAPKK